MLLKKKFKFFIFDLDGVIFDSKKNMEFSWRETSKYFSLKKSFKVYFSQIGIPFDKILKKIGVKPNIKIENYYKKQSMKFSNKIRLYKNVKLTLDLLNKKKIPYSIVTSKDLERSKFFLKKYNIKPKSLHCPSKKFKGKPNPDLILNSMKKNKKLPKDSCYVGDTFYDFISSKNAKISFIFASYGYGKKNINYKLQIKKFSDILKFI